MVAQVLILTLVVAALALWLASREGRIAVRTVAGDPVLLGVVAATWGVMQLLPWVGLLGGGERLLDLPWVGLPLTTSMILVWTLHLIASTIVVWRIASVLRPADEVGPLMLFPGIALAQFLAWAVFLAAIPILTLLGTMSFVVLMLVFIVPMILLTLFLNVLQARFAAALIQQGGAIGKAFHRVRASGRTCPTTWPLVLLRLLATGAIVVVWLVGFTYVRSDDSTDFTTGTTTTTVSSFNVNVSFQSILTINCENGWPGEIAEAVDMAPPAWLSMSLGLLTALLAVVFLVAILRRLLPPLPNAIPSTGGPLDAG